MTSESTNKIQKQRNTEPSTHSGHSDKFVVSDRREGFTLVEILIYITIMSLTIGSSLVVVFNLIEGSGKLMDIAKVEEEANFIFKKFEWAFVDASGINSPSQGLSSSTISINKTNFGSNPIVFNLDSGNITMSVNGGMIEILNSESISVDGLSFTHIASIDKKPVGLRSEFTLNGKPYSSQIYLR